MYITCSGSRVVSGELLCTAGQRQYLLLRPDGGSGGVRVLAGVLPPAATLLFLLCCFSSGCRRMQSVAPVSLPVCNSVSAASAASRQAFLICLLFSCRLCEEVKMIYTPLHLHRDPPRKRLKRQPIAFPPQPAKHRATRYRLRKRLIYRKCSLCSGEKKKNRQEIAGFVYTV